MRHLLIGVAVACSAASASQAVAAERMNDAAYLRAARCSGLAQGRGLDVAALAETLRAQKHGRAAYIADSARTARRTAQREGANAASAARVDAELAACAAYFPADQLTQRPAGAPG